jgi:putative transposase
MPNHFHFLIKQKSDIPLSKFIGALFNAYNQAVNLEQKRKGPLLEGRFKHVLVDQEEYLVHLCRYIHLNPVKAGIVKAPGDWRYSDYGSWISSKADTLWENQFVREYFMSPKEYEEFVCDYQDDSKSSEQLNDYFID